MAGGLPTGWDVCAGTDYGAVLASTAITGLTASATINSFVGVGWTALGTLAYDTSLLAVSLLFSSAGRTGLINIGVGTPGNQKVLFANIPVRASSVNNDAADFLLPCDLPGGTQIWAQIQSATASDASHFIKINGFSGSFTQQAGPGGGEGVGVTTANSLQTSITGGAANTYGTPSQLAASTLHDYGSIVSVFIPASGVAYFYALGIGASGSEQWIVPNQYVGPAAMSYVWLPIAIKAGTRVAMKCQTVAGAQIGWGGLIGIFR